MANRWQMAKAFGRAVANSLDDKATDLVLGPTIKKNGAEYSERLAGKTANSPENKALRQAWREESDKMTESELSGKFDYSQSESTDKSLQKDFDEAFEESFNKAKGTFGEAMDKLGGYTLKDKEQAYDRLRQLMIDKLKNGESIQDVLDWGKNKFILIK